MTEIGRYEGVTKEQHLCVLCDLILLKMNFTFSVNELRKALFEKVQVKNPD